MFVTYYMLHMLFYMLVKFSRLAKDIDLSGIFEEVEIFMFAGHDTTTSGKFYRTCKTDFKGFYREYNKLNISSTHAVAFNFAL